jgi:hypothetical protein
MSVAKYRSYVGLIVQLSVQYSIVTASRALLVSRYMWLGTVTGVMAELMCLRHELNVNQVIRDFS